jgi:hypothetical protein
MDGEYVWGVPNCTAEKSTEDGLNDIVRVTGSPVPAKGKLSAALPPL